MKQLKRLWNRMFNPYKSIYGPRIFEQESWLSRKAKEAAEKSDDSIGSYVITSF